MATVSRSAAITLIRAARRCRGWLEQLAAAALAALAVATTAPRARRADALADARGKLSRASLLIKL